MASIVRQAQEGIVVARNRSVRLLSALGGASTSRVFNLHGIAADNARDPEYLAKPLFVSAIVNRCFILKHRTRTDEAYLFAAPRPVSTKIIIPFDNDDLRAGGYSVFVDQRGYADMLRNSGHYTSEGLERDLAVLKLINALPSLDPFLLREHLRAMISRSRPAISRSPKATASACSVSPNRNCRAWRRWRAPHRVRPVR